MVKTTGLCGLTYPEVMGSILCTDEARPDPKKSLKARRQMPGWFKNKFGTIDAGRVCVLAMKESEPVSEGSIRVRGR